MADINKVGALILREGRILFCRKSRETSKLILPGGRIETGESEIDCLRRELCEELGDVGLTSPVYLGSYEDRAAHDDPTVVRSLRIALYRVDLVGAPRPSGEIVELVWFGPGSDWSDLTPICVNRVLPDLLARGVLPWPPR